MINLDEQVYLKTQIPIDFVFNNAMAINYKSS